ncbi:MAG: hypothetical protein JSU87_10905 [Gemmatimonadota bacterium]|nr:MAG: hypothetical protein JSU87_10905 [Gemmatimonadota bacterium]
MRAIAICLLAGLAAPVVADSAWAQSKGPKIRIAVMEPEWDPGVVQSAWVYGENSPNVYVEQRQTFARGLNEMMIAELLKSDRFIVVERKALEDVFAEQNLQYSGAVNPETAVQAGRVVGAQFFIRPTITEFAYGEEGGTKGGAVKVPTDVPVAGGIRIGGGKAKIEARLVIDSRVYDIETAQITASVKGEGSADQKMSGISLETDVFDYNSAGFNNTPLGAATRAAVEETVKNLVAELGDRPWQGSVVTVRDGQVYLNAGEDSGVKVGDAFEVFRPGEELVDPDTGLKLGQVEEKLGRLKVTSVQEKFSIASAEGGFTCERGDIVRYVGQ